MDRAVFNIKWEKHIAYIKGFLSGKKGVPKYVKRYGAENFKMKDSDVCIFNRKLVLDQDEKNKIIDAEDEKYGGLNKAFERISRKYIGISRSDVQKRFRGSERRQMKQTYHPQKVNQIFAARPGHVEIDLTFYRNQKIPIFGAIDVYSRYIYYKRVPNKQAASVVVALKEFIKKFESVTKFKVFKISTDSGVEFADFKKYIEETPQRIIYDRQVKSRKMIENLNKSLRMYVERIGWDTIADLDDLVAKFVESYNDSKHSTTKKIPNEMVKEAVAVERPTKPTSGYRMAKLEKGDTVRLYDPRRLDIKEKMKETLKGKIKLKESDYVKRYTSFHRGQDPHWSNKIYTIKEVHVGKKRANRYLLNEKKGFFFRHELQKVVPITKEDPRKKIMSRREKVAERYKELIPKSVRKSKYERKDMIIHYEDEDEPRTNDKATCLMVYRDHLIVAHESELFTFAKESEVSRVFNKTHTKAKVAKWIKNTEVQIANAKSEIDTEFDDYMKQAKKDVP